MPSVFVLAIGKAAWNVARGPVPRDRSVTSMSETQAAGVPVARGPVPRDRCHIENRPRPRVSGRFLSRPQHGEGQALALR